MLAAGSLHRTAAFPHRHQLAPSTASAVGAPERSPELALNRQSAATSATQPRPIVTPSTANNRKPDHNQHLEIPRPNDNDGKCPSKFLCAPAFLRARGSVGRTPTIWDWGLRLSYDRLASSRTTARPKLVLDLFHVFSQKSALRLDEQHYFSIDSNGNQINPNPRYLQPILYQPPFSARLGMEVDY